MLKQIFGFIFLFCSMSTMAAEKAPRIMVLGDSLSAAFGIEQDAGWVRLLQQHLLNEGYRYKVINASISGETTSGGLARIDSLLKRDKPQIIILVLGANDGLRGTPLQLMRDNLSLIIQKIHARQAKVILVGMRLPPNYGSAYSDMFYESFDKVARQYDIPLVPFLLHGLGKDSKFFQADGLHPNREAQAVLLNNIWLALEKEIEK